MSVPRTALRPVLLVDDDLDDVFILSRLVQKSGLRNPLQFARNGEEAIRLLSKVAVDSVFLPPIAIFTDLHMPRSDGFALLSWIRERPALSRVFVAVVSISDLPYDIRRAYHFGCNAYVRKYPSVQDCAYLVAAAECFAENRTPEFIPGLTRDYAGI